MFFGLLDYFVVLSRNPIHTIGESLVKVKSVTKVSRLPSVVISPNYSFRSKNMFFAPAFAL